MRTLFITLLLSFFSTTVSFAQGGFRPGYVITLTKDTVHGLVGYREGRAAYQSCEFKRSQKDDIAVYDATQISGYGFDGDKYFESRQIVDEGAQKVVFLQVIVSGRVTLYRFEKRFLIEKDHQGLQALSNQSQVVKLGGKDVIRETNEYIGIVNILLFDCAELRPSLRNFDLDERALTELVERYHQCIGTSSTTYKADKPWVKGVLNIAAGLNLPNVDVIAYSNNVPSYYVSDYEPRRPAMGGLSVDISSPRIHEQFSFLIGALYLAPAYYGYLNYTNESGMIITNYVTLKYRSLKVPFGLRYSFKERMITPFVDGGLINTFQLSTKSSWLQEAEAYGVVATFHGSDIPMDNYTIGYWAGAGAFVKLPYGFSGLAEVRYEITGGLLRGYMLTRMRNLHFIVGIRTDLEW